MAQITYQTGQFSILRVCTILNILTSNKNQRTDHGLYRADIFLQVLFMVPLYQILVAFKFGHKQIYIFIRDEVSLANTHYVCWMLDPWSVCGRNFVTRRSTTIQIIFHSMIIPVNVCCCCFQNGLPLKLRSIHIVNAPFIARSIIKLGLSVMSEKMKSRLIIHDQLSSLHESFPEDMLPLSLGGMLSNEEGLDFDVITKLLKRNQRFGGMSNPSRYEYKQSNFD